MIHGEECWPDEGRIAPCQFACPIHMDVPGYIMALAQGRFTEAISIVRETNPFPSICGRVCPHPCEEACNRSVIDEPLAIEWLKRSIGDLERRTADPPQPVERTREERVAVIGSGPAGLTAAHDLVRQGYGVTVYEALPVPGGMFAAGIPSYNLPPAVVSAEVEYIMALGVEIRTNMRVGRDVTLDELWGHGFNAVLVAVGAWKSPVLSIPGIELDGVRQALPMLRDAKLGEKIKLKGTVVVIGGGNVAADAARTAIRLGADTVRLTCLEARDEMPAFPWEIEAAEREGVEILPAMAPQRITSKTGRRVNGIEFKRVTGTSRDDVGRMSWTLAEDAEPEILEANAVIIAIGQAPEASFVDPALLTERGTLKMDPVTLATDQPGLFAAGDVADMAGNVVDAIAAGHTAARSIHRHLRNEDLVSDDDGDDRVVFEVKPEMVPAFLQKRSRWEMPEVSARDSIRSFGETELGYADWQVREEAKRCMNCGMCGSCVFGHGQLCYETSTRLLTLK
jgi:NADPH-dependent glutamate synthase beta subunit-like oxidoreductase